MNGIVANWYYLAFIVAVTVLHVVNNLAVPLAWNESNSVSLFGGGQV